MPVSTHPGGGNGGLDLAASYRVQKKGAKGVRPTASHLDLKSQLLDAVQQEKPRAVRRLLDTRADPNCCTALSETPLMLACSVQSEEARQKILELLLKKGAKVDMQDSSGKTALMKAVILNDTETTFTLLNAHSDVSLEDSDGNNALCHAARLGNEELVQRLVRESKRRKVDVDHRNMRGLTPLLIACQEGHLICARILVSEGGASPTIRDLDNFMNAGEWMKLSGFYTAAELAFLSPSTQKRNYYRRQRQMRGIKTLSDFLPVQEESVEGCASSNVFCMRRESDRDSRRTSFPIISDSSSTHSRAQSLASNPTASGSMFDFPSQPKKQTTPGHALGKPVPVKPALDPKTPFSTVKTDLYHSPYLAQRQHYLSQNRRSQFYRRGSLEPLSSGTLEKVRQLDPGSKQSSLGEVSKHSVLPPLKRRGSK